MSLEHLALFFLATLLLGILLGRVSSRRAHEAIDALNEGRIEVMKKSSKELLKLHEDFIRIHFDYVDVYGDVAATVRKALVVSDGTSTSGKLSDVTR